MPPSIALMLRSRPGRQAIERALAARGVHGDTMIAHISPAEALMLRQAGGVGTRNPRTGLPQFYVGGGPGGLAAGGDTETGRQAADRSAGGPGGYGNATGDRGSGLGAGGGHSGNNYTSQQFGNRPPQVIYVQAPAAPPASNMPGPPVSTTPMMSSTSTADMTGGRFGATPGWATTPYQIGTVPTSYPTPGVNTSIGAPGSGGATAPGGGTTGAGSGGGAGGGIIDGVAGPGGVAGTGITGGLLGGPGGAGSAVHLQNGGMGVTAPDGSVIPLNYGAPGTAPTLPNGQTLAQYQGSLLFGITPKMPATNTAAAAPPSGQTYAQQAAQKLGITPQAQQAAPQASLAAPGIHPSAQAQPSISAAAPSSLGGLGGLGGMSVSAGPPRQTGAVAIAPTQSSAQAQAAKLLGVAPTPAKPAAAPQPVVTPQQSLLGLLTVQPAAKPAALAAATSKAPNKTTASLLTPKPATAAKKPAGKTNR